MPLGRVGTYRLERPLAAGGMSTVWRARDVYAGLPVAVKVVATGDPGLRAALDREARALARLDHPGIVWLHDVGVVGPEAPGLPAGAPWIALEYAHRGSLADAAAPSRWEGLRELLDGLLAALAHVHARGLSHRDVKPSNVLLGTDRPGPKLSDFGLGAPPGPDAPAGGTPGFLAPEAWDAPGGAPADVYAVGVLAYALASGGRPFPDRDPAALRAAHQRRPPPPLAPRLPLPEPFGAWLAALLAKDPVARPTAAAARRSLAALPEAPEGPPAPSTALDDEATRTALGPARPAAPSGPPSPSAPPPSPRRAEANPRPPTARSGRAPAPAAAPVSGPGPVALREPPTVGREAERDTLWAALSGGGAAAIVGPAGSGRRHLARWLAESSAEADGPLVRVDEHPSGTVFVRVGDAQPAELPEVRLDPLPDACVAELVRRAAPLDRAALAAVVSEAAGNPGRALARVRGWAREGRLERTSAGMRVVGALPPAAPAGDLDGALRAARGALLAGDAVEAERWLAAVEAAAPTGRARARLLAERAQLASVVGQPAEAGEHGAACLALAVAGGWAAEEVIARLMLARAALASDPAAARGHAEAALALAESAGVPGGALARNLAGNARRALGDPEGAEAHFREALARAGDYDALPSLLALARLAWSRGDRAGAEAWLERADATAARLGTPAAAVRAATERAEVALRDGRPADAVQPLRAATDHWRAVAGPPGWAAEVLLGEALLATGQPAAARAHAVNALAGARAAGDRGPVAAAAALLWVASVAHAPGPELDEALSALPSLPDDDVFARLRALAVGRAADPEALRRALDPA